MIVGYLRSIADAVEAGSYEADAVAVVLAIRAIPQWIGYHAHTWPELHALALALSDEHLAADYEAKHPGATYNPYPHAQESAYRRRDNWQRMRDEAEADRLAHPYRCRCKYRSATNKGRDAHIRAMHRLYPASAAEHAEDGIERPLEPVLRLVPVEVAP